MLSLVYLARQIKNSAEVGKTASYHQAIEQLLQGALAPGAMSLLFRVRAGESLDDEEQFAYGTLLSTWLYSHEILMYLHQKGQIDDALWENIFRNNLDILQHESVLEISAARPGPLAKQLYELLEKGEPT